MPWRRTASSATPARPGEHQLKHAIAVMVLLQQEGPACNSQLLMLCSTLRGVARHCPQLKALWSSQEVTDIVSKVAGMPLRPVMDYELGVCNVQAKPLLHDAQLHACLQVPLALMEPPQAGS